MIGLSSTPILETERLTLRAPHGDDWPHWRAFHESERGVMVGGGPDQPVGQSWRAFGHVIGHWVMRGFGMFVFTRKADPHPLGLIGPWFPDGWPEREIGWTVWSPAAEGRGYAFEAAGAARYHALTALGWDTAVSYIRAGNLRSIRLAERLGARRDITALTPGAVPDCLVYRHLKGAAA